MARALFLALLFCCALAAQQDPPEPPEEDESLKPKEYSLNPVQSKKEITAGNFYLKKGNYRAAATRYLEATRWDSGSPEAFLKWGEASEKARDYNAARAAYTKYIELAGDAKNVPEIKARMAKWPKQRVTPQPPPGSAPLETVPNLKAPLPRSHR